MRVMRVSLLVRVLLVVGFAALGASKASAQSIIAGVARDTSGAVLPGVTVEASSDVLIEKSRSVTTDGDGRYSIVDLRPGTYSITFTLAGFNTFKRDGVIVPSNVTVPINAEMKVGSLQETVTVTGQSPVVDVQNVSKIQVITRDLMDAIPTARNMQAIGALVPGVRLNIPDVGGAQQTEQTYMAAHGNSALHNTILLDGMPAQTNLSDGAVQNYIDNAMIAESVYQTSAISAESSAGGVKLNLVPKDGGNAIHGSGFFGGAHDDWNLQADNVNDYLRGRGLGTGARINHLYDWNGAMGGPVMKDRLWYYGTARRQGTFIQVPNTFKNDGSPGIEDAWINSFALRGTWQASQKNKVAITYQRNYKYKLHEIFLGGQEGIPIFPEQTAGYRAPWLYYIGQAKWTSTLTSRLLLEVGMSADILHYYDIYQPGTGYPRGSAEWYANASHLDTVGGNSYRTKVGQIQQWNTPDQKSATAAISYVTGTHNIKTGFLYGWGNNPSTVDMNADLYQIYQGGTLVGNQYTLGAVRNVRVYNTPITRHPDLKANVGIFAQDQWAIGKFTFNYGLRWEYLSEGQDAVDRAAGRFAPAAHYDAINCDTIAGMTCWKNWTPRLGAAYDLFGDGKTALKMSFGKYMTPDVSNFVNLFNPIATFNETRNWTDANGDDIAQDTEIAASNNPNFGKVTSRSLDPNFTREYNYQWGAGIQHEVMSGVALNFNWYRRTLQNTQYTRNRAVDPVNDWTTTNVVNPISGENITVYQINQNKASVAPDLYLTNQKDTSLRANVYSGFEVGANARLARRILVFGGWSLERTVDVDCAMNTPNSSSTTNSPNTLRFCDQSGKTNQSLGANADIPYQNGFKVNGNVPLWYGVEVSASLQSYPGTIKQTSGGLNWAITRGTTRYPNDCAVAGCVPGAIVLPARFASDPAITLQLASPGTRYEPHYSQLDFGVRRTFKIRGVTAQAQVDLFNATNSGAILSEGTALTTAVTPFLSSSPDAGGTPLTILQPRLIRIGAQLRF
jgi:hypothetical protein